MLFKYDKSIILLTKRERLKLKNPDLSFFINCNGLTCKEEFRCYASMPLK